MAISHQIMKRKCKPRKMISFKSLPDDLLTKILALVASNSLADLFNTEMSCKELLRVGNEDFIFQHASMERFPVAPWPISDKAADLFVKRCRESGNAEALFRDGMYEYFSLGNMNPGIELLKKAVEKGHVEGTYVYGIIQVISSANDDDQLKRRRGLDVFSSLRKSRPRKFRVWECRRKVERVIGDLWVSNAAVPINALFSSEKSKDCNCKEANGQINRGWDEEEDGDGDLDLWCDSCLLECEVTWFCYLLRNSGHVN